MKEDSAQRLKSILTAAPQEGASTLEQARALYDQLSREVPHLIEEERAKDRARGPLAKALLATSLFIGVLAAGVLFYGVIRFPDAPIRQVGTGYVSKAGKPRTRQEFEQFKLWEKALVGTFGFVFLVCVSTACADKLKRSRSGG
jgi:hypothetical protein